MYNIWMIEQNISRIRQRISEICSSANKEAADITIVAITKSRPADEVRQALQAGITDIGENKVQEAIVKFNEIGTAHDALRVTWHMVGHLQTNKVKDAVKIFDLIQSVDSLRLAEEIDKQAGRINKIQDVLIEIKISPEQAKSGIKPEEAVQVIERLSRLKNIRAKGLMTIAPAVAQAESARAYFRQLRELRDKIKESSWILSMGMSDDFEVAIEEGANMVRLGRAIFD
ncbi:MAG: YggS family pyridoxal phosphate-dependent enzyme [Candidatus Omnitrophica bacterium]|nr:YggS family pyridoxal phosphate-dependent enzyme [Candidatus Omnitrophota bacterium]